MVVGKTFIGRRSLAALASSSREDPFAAASSWLARRSERDSTQWPLRRKLVQRSVEASVAEHGQASSGLGGRIRALGGCPSPL
jgi:hypothetical protein